MVQGNDGALTSTLKLAQHPKKEKQKTERIGFLLLFLCQWTLLFHKLAEIMWYHNHENTQEQPQTLLT